MKLNLNLILHDLRQKPELIAGKTDFPLVITTPMIYSDEKQFSDGFLFFGKWDDFSRNGAKPRHAVCIGGGEAARAYFSKCGNALIYPESTDLLALYKQVQKIFIRYDELENRLVKHVIENAATRIILNDCAEFFKALVALYGNNSTLIDYSSRYEPSKDDAQWQEIVRTRVSSLPPIPRESIQMLPNTPQSPKASWIQIKEVPRHFNYGFDYGYLRFATLVITETGARLDEKLQWLVDYVAELISPLITERYNNSLDHRNSVRTAVYKILREQGGNPLMIQNSLKWLSWKEDDLYQMIVVSLPKYSQNISHYLYNYENIFAERQQDTLSLFYEDYIIILLHDFPDAEMMSCLSVMEKQLDMDDGTACVTMPFCGFSQIYIQYDFAQINLRVFPSDKRIMFYRDIMVRHVFTQCNAAFPLRSICHYAAVLVHNHDLEFHTEYLRTLETYLMCNKSLMAASNALFIHRSTLTYRLKCIEKIVNIDYNDAQVRFHILLSCVILRTLSAANEAQPLPENQESGI